jgi:hypothetical protein
MVVPQKKRTTEAQRHRDTEKTDKKKTWRLLVLTAG